VDLLKRKSTWRSITKKIEAWHKRDGAVLGCLAADARAQGAEEVCRAAARRFPNHPGVVEKASLALETMSSA
jgi:hypothetical protein